jgi:NAD(P)-dependent dehydrogenase (short-subunit alcohol dehydrogenase family)
VAGGFAYSSSKSGLEGISDALRRELMLFGIEVVIIEPGTAKTAIYDKGEKRAKPKARYAIVPQRFKNWTLPRLLTVRMLDARLAKAFGFTKP